MNKQEVIEHLMDMRDEQGNYNNYPLESRKRFHAVGQYEGLSSALNLIDEQLDEPEITKEQALNKLAESYPFSADGINAILQAQLAGYSPVSTMKFSQSNEPELPVIPQFFAEYIDSARRENATLLGAMDHFFNSKEIKSWMRVNQELFAKAWLSTDGYTIEPQPIKTRQVLVKFFDNEEYKTELTEDSARELIEFLEANKK